MVMEPMLIGPTGTGWGLATGLAALDATLLKAEAPQPQRTDVVATAAALIKNWRREIVGYDLGRFKGCNLSGE
jgi:hypothetical protein